MPVQLLVLLLLGSPLAVSQLCPSPLLAPTHKVRRRNLTFRILLSRPSATTFLLGKSLNLHCSLAHVTLTIKKWGSPKPLNLLCDIILGKKGGICPPTQQAAICEKSLKRINTTTHLKNFGKLLFSASLISLLLGWQVKYVTTQCRRRILLARFPNTLLFLSCSGSFPHAEIGIVILLLLRRAWPLHIAACFHVAGT